MIQQAPVFIVLLPLTAALFCMLVSKFSKRLGSLMVLAAIAGAFFSALSVLCQTLAAGKPVHYWMGGWAPPLGIEFVLDPLNALLAVVITFVSILVFIYSRPFFKNEDWLQVGGYNTLFALLTVGMCGMVITGDVFNLYVYLEVMSLAGYGLIALGGRKSMIAAFRYLLLGTIGASLYLIGVAYLYAMTGTLNMADMAARVAPQLDSPLFAAAVACFVIGFGIKMALFPLHGWQPDSYTYAHPAAAPFIAGVMSKIPAYAIIRFLFYLFGTDNYVVASALNLIGVLGAAGILLGSVMALAQYDMRRLLAYSSVAQIGYIAVGLALGNVYGFIGAVLHIISHAFMKSSLFLVAGGLQYRFGETNIYRLGGIGQKMKLSSMTLVLAAFSMVGLPPTAGFFSKLYLLIGSYESGQYIYIAVLVISSLLNAVYFTRILEQIMVTKEGRLEDKETHEGACELPLAMLVPIVVAGIGVLALGIFSADIVEFVIKSGLPEVLLK